MVVDFWRKRNYYFRCWRLNFNKHRKEANQGNCLNADVSPPGLASSLWMNTNGPAERALMVWAVFKWLSKVIARVRLLRLLIGWKISRHFFNQWDAKSKRIAHCTRDFSRALRKLHVITKNSDWFIRLFTPVVIGQNNYFCRVFHQSFENRSITLYNSEGFYDKVERKLFCLFISCAMPFVSAFLCIYCFLILFRCCCFWSFMLTILSLHLQLA